MDGRAPLGEEDFPHGELVTTKNTFTLDLQQIPRSTWWTRSERFFFFPSFFNPKTRSVHVSRLVRTRGSDSPHDLLGAAHDGTASRWRQVLRLAGWNRSAHRSGRGTSQKSGVFPPKRAEKRREGHVWPSSFLSSPVFAPLFLF